MTRDEFCFTFWRYYLLLEKDYLETERYIEPDLGDNYLFSVSLQPETYLGNSTVYSMELLKQLNMICAEVDAVCRSLSAEFLGKRADGMKDFSKNVLSLWPAIINQEVSFRGKNLLPFEGWNTNDKTSSPKWWGAYTACKHGRREHFYEANLKNVVNALAGLYILESYYVRDLGIRNKDIDVPNELSAIFRLRDFKTKHTLAGSGLYYATIEDIDNMFTEPKKGTINE